MIQTRYIVDVLHDANYQQAAAVVAKKVDSFINNNGYTFLDFSHTIHDSGNSKTITIVIVYREGRE